jgi:rubrerythrin
LIGEKEKSRVKGKQRKMTIQEILRKAIQGEDESYALYTNALNLVQAEHIKKLLRELAQEELGHKATLEKMLAAPDQLQWQVQELKTAPIDDYKIGDYLVAQPLGPDSTFQDVCIFASKKEQQSYELYRDLAAQSKGETRDLLEAMAKEELRHKNLVEGWYEEVVYQEF